MDKYLTAKEAAALLGITTRTLWRWIQLERVRPLRVGKGIRFSREEVLRQCEMQEFGRAPGRDFALE